MTTCAFCGRDNDGSSRFCMDCGKPLSPSAAAAATNRTAARAGEHEGERQPAAVGVAEERAPALAMSAASGVPPTRVPGAVGRCPSCRSAVDPGLPYCAHCGARTGYTNLSGATCAKCGWALKPGVDAFCPKCGTANPVKPKGEGTAVFSATTTEKGARVSLLNEEGAVAQTFAIASGEVVIGRSDGDIHFPHDHYLSPVHAQLSWREGHLFVRDLGSRNGTWVFLEGPHKLQDADVLLVGSQLLRFRRLGYPGPHPPEADSTRRMGSLTPTADIAILEQLRNDRSVRDTYHLSPGRNVTIGRENAEWLFPYDRTMSGRHAEIRSEDSDFYVHDAGSRNGIAIGIRGEWELKKEQRLMLGDQILRVESV